MTGKMVIFSGPSGVGKDTLLDRWIAADPRVVRVVTYTTREPRAGEVDGRDYHFVPVDRFKQLAAEGAFLEWKEVYGNFYASPLRDTEAHLAQERIAVLKIDVQGALEVMPLRTDAITIFVAPPSYEELERRIRLRALDPEDVIQKRLAKARWESEQACKYRYTVVNDDLDRAVAELRKLAG
jgi:guanylate kinase